VSDTASGKGAFIGSYARHARMVWPLSLNGKGQAVRPTKKDMVAIRAMDN